MSELFNILKDNGWVCKKYMTEKVSKAVDQWKIRHKKTNEVARLWEVRIPETDRTHYIVFWNYAKKSTVEVHPSGKDKCTEWKLLIDYAYTEQELDYALKNTLNLLCLKKDSSLIKAKLMPGFDMLGGEEK